MTAKTLSTIFGLAFIAVGILGFIDNPVVGDSPDAIFLTDGLHNGVHLASGVLFLLIPLMAPGAINGFMILFGVVYLALGVIGLFSMGTTGMGKILGILHVNGADNFLHVGLGLAILLGGLATKKAAASGSSA